MKKRRLKYLLVIFSLLLSATIDAQLTASDTSEKSVRRYQNVIKNNRQLIRFIEYSLHSRGVPIHMRNLAIIESGLDHEIVSSAGATGLWQFMIPHANQYGLSAEDRTDMYKSTKTAVNSLISAYNKYGNWVTVVAAYNCGDGNIKKAMDRAGSKRYTDFAPYLPAESRGHVQKFLNASYATGELSQVLNDYYKTAPAPKKNTVAAKTKEPKQTEEKPKPVKKFVTGKKGFEEYTINSAYNIDVIAEFLKISKTDILKWNPNIEKKLAVTGESTFFLPENKMIEFKLNRNKILSDSLKRQKNGAAPL